MNTKSSYLWAMCVLWTHLISSSGTVPTGLTPELSKRLENAYVFSAGNMHTYAMGGPILGLYNGVYIYYQNSDSNFVVRVNGNPVWNSEVVAEGGCGANGQACQLWFQSDGNLVSYVNNQPLWNTQTHGEGQWLVFFDVSPYIVIYNAAYQPIWQSMTPAPPPTNGNGKGGSVQPSGGSWEIYFDGEQEDDENGEDDDGGDD